MLYVVTFILLTFVHQGSTDGPYVVRDGVNVPVSQLER